VAPAVHQFIPGLQRRDAIGDEVLAIRALLRGAGYDSEIFVGSPGASGSGLDVHPLDAYGGTADGLLLYHHALGSDYVGLLSRLPDRLVLRYHNITPARFYRDSAAMVSAIERGARQLAFLRRHTVGALIASQFNAADLRAVGYTDIVQVPSVFSVPRLLAQPRAARDRLPLPVRVLFVGRGSANKRQDQVVTAFEHFAARYAPDAELALVGNLYSDPSWGEALSEQIAASPWQRQISCPGMVSEAMLAEHYRRASLFLSMSEHEGFGVPLVESFAHGVPVLAYDVPGVRETLGDAGVMFAHKRWPEVAALMAELCFDAELRARVIAAQDVRLTAFDADAAGATLLAAVARWLPQRAPRRPHRPRGVGLISSYDGGGEVVACTRALSAALRAAGIAAPIFADLTGVRVGADPPDVERLTGDPSGVVSALLERDVAVAHVHTHLGRFPYSVGLAQWLVALRRADLPVVVSLYGPMGHAGAAVVPALEALASCDAVLVHNASDLHYLRGHGLRNVATAPYGVAPLDESQDELADRLGMRDRRTVGFLGAPLHGSGLREAIEAVYLLRPRLPQLRLIALAPAWPGTADGGYLAACRARIAKLELEDAVWLIDDLLSDRAATSVLSACELVVVPGAGSYGEPAATLRLPLGARRPTIAGSTLLLDGADAAVHTLDGLAPQAIAAAIEDLLADDVRRAALAAGAAAFATAHAWPRVAAVHAARYAALAERTATTDTSGAHAAGGLT
jgi:glycosyltransferase involved in cell wall biosynthesis